MYFYKRFNQIASNATEDCSSFVEVHQCTRHYLISKYYNINDYEEHLFGD